MTETQGGVTAMTRIFNAVKVLLCLPFAFVGEMFRSFLGMPPAAVVNNPGPMKQQLITVSEESEPQA